MESVHHTCAAHAVASKPDVWLRSIAPIAIALVCCAIKFLLRR
jgi:hypothetical protein